MKIAGEVVETRQREMEFKKGIREQVANRARRLKSAAASSVGDATGGGEPQKKKPKKTAPCPLPEDDELLSEDCVVSMYPEICRVHKDHFNGRWPIYWRYSHIFSWRDVSMSWGRKSSLAAATECLRVVWRWAQSFGKACPYSDMVVKTT